nr:hypothetical transcript [Hymenolepis microstoma]
MGHPSKITCFGQTPSQLLTTPHSPRGSSLAACPRLFFLPTHEVAARLHPTSRAPLLCLYFVSHANELEPLNLVF